MKRIIILILFSISLNSICFAQKFEVLNQNAEYRFKKAPKEFYYISPELDSLKGIEIAELKFYARDKGERISLVPVFYSLWKRANKLGANSFSINKVIYSSEKERYDIIVKLYFLNEDEIEENIDLYPNNLVVVIGNVNISNDEKMGKVFRINNDEYSLYPFEYIAHQNEIDSQVDIQVGAAFVTIPGEENKLPQIYSIGGLTVTPTVGFGGSGGLEFRDRTISLLDMNLGLFLMGVIDERR